MRNVLIFLFIGVLLSVSAEDAILDSGEDQATLNETSEVAFENEESQTQIDSENQSETSSENLETDSLKNETSANSTETEKGPKTSPKKITCLPYKGMVNESLEENRIEILNGTALINLLNDQTNSNVTNRTTPAICSVVLFYAPWCPFSAKAAPHYNGLARIFPDLVMIAVDANRHHSFTTQFGVLALPTILLFHNAKTFIKFNQTDFELENFTTFFTTFTGIEPRGELVLHDLDFEGPMPCEHIPETDIYLHISWIFVVLCGLGYFGKSAFCQGIIEAIRNNWREAEIQHEHND